MNAFFRVPFLAILAVLTAGIAVSQGKKGSPPGKVEPYTIEAQALNGPSSTDIVVTVQTNDVSQYPIPATLKKLHITVYDDFDNTLYNRNFFNVPVVGGQVVVTVDGLQPGLLIRVQALVQTEQTVNTQVLRASTVVLKRPDLTVNSISAPPQVFINAPFDVAVVVKELNMQLGATATVNLLDGADLLASVSGVVVPAGGLVTVQFQAMHLDSGGSHILTASITNAEPAEYNTTNNSSTVTVEVLTGIPVTPVSGYFEYSSVRNSTFVDSVVWCSGYYANIQQQDYDQIYLQADLPSDGIPESPIDKFSWQFISGNGTVSEGSLTNLTPYFNDGFFEYYDLGVIEADGSQLIGQLTVSTSSGIGSFNFSKWAGSALYIYRDSDGISTVIEESSNLMNFEDFVEIRILLTDGDIAVGGGVRLELLPYEHFSLTDTFSFDLDGCLYTVVTQFSSDESFNSFTGQTDSTLIPTTRRQGQPQLTNVTDLPQVTELAQNYPNPFNPSTNLSFTMELDGPAQLRVYNLLGQEVAELFHGHAEGGRLYTFRFDASGLPSGMYYARFDGGGKQHVRKMLLTK